MVRCVRLLNLQCFPFNIFLYIKCLPRVDMSSNPWIKHVKAVAKKQGITYGEALKVGKKTYKGGVMSGGVSSGGKKKKTLTSAKRKGGAAKMSKYATLLSGKSVKLK